MPTYILGISAFYHDSAACLLKDGKLVAATQEERFSRKRHDSAFPILSIQYCLKNAGIGLSDLSLIAYYEKPFLKFERILETVVDKVPSTYPFAIRALPIWASEKIWIKKTIRKELEVNTPILFMGHHESHAASAFFPSPFEEAATLTVDGVGEWSTTTWGVGRGNRLDLKAEIRYPHSLGLLYSAFTQYLGFKVNSGEYKVMGLAPYGDPIYADLIKNNLIEIFQDGSFLLNMDYFSFSKMNEMINSRFDTLFKVQRRKDETPIEKFHADVAKSLQEVTEEVMLKLSNHVYQETKLKNLCLAGGVALNCVANGRILKEGKFEEVWIQPGAGDSGGAVGAAYLAWHHYLGESRPISKSDAQFGSFLGPSFESGEIEPTFKKYGLTYELYSTENQIQKTAELLAEQNIVGWFQGRMEFGPRSLGARSILGDARNPEMQIRMNLKIKFRESFRPFAPSVLKEEVKNYFDMDVDSPYMLLTCPVKRIDTTLKNSVNTKNNPRWMHDMLAKNPSQELPSITHVDGSARVQSVEKKSNPAFHRLLEIFNEKTGSPVLINTSFNVRGEPIVCTPEDAVRCFIKSDIDVLSIGNYIVTRKAQDPKNLENLRDRVTKEDHFELD